MDRIHNWSLEAEGQFRELEKKITEHLAKEQCTDEQHEKFWMEMLKSCYEENDNDMMSTELTAEDVEVLVILMIMGTGFDDDQRNNL